MRINGPIQQSFDLGVKDGRDFSKIEKKQEIDPPVKVLELKEKDFPEDKLIKAIEKANKALVQRTTQLEFSIHEKTKEIMVKVLDRETNEVIREIPPEKILDMVAKLWEMAGILVDERR